jgi:carboxymethylenebutenolidase
MSNQSENNLSPRQQKMLETFQQHVYAEITGDLTTTLATMNANPYVYHVPTMTGGEGKEGVRHFYANHLVGKFLPPDAEVITLSRTFGEHQLVEEGVARFTHTMMMDSLLPDIAPTGKRVEIAIVVLVGFDADGKITYERIYWDQASVLVQLGLLDPTGLPIKGAECVQRLMALAGPQFNLHKRGDN